jgi:Cu(I)/Ag(I) efflux system membrane protein CusA/SilA
LGDVAAVFIEDGPPGIKSENARLNGWTFVDLDRVDVGGYVERAREVVSERIDLPPGYSISWAGQYEYMERAKARLGYVVPLTLAVIVILLYMNFRNFTQVAILIGALPLSLVGSVWLMYWLGYNFSVAVGVGLIALAGVAVETGVIMIVYLDQSLQRLHQSRAGQPGPIDGQMLFDAVLEGASARVRPVVMTAGATIAGLLPILYGSGSGSEIMSRLAAPMVGGMLSTVLLTLLVLPVIYLEWHRARLSRAHRSSDEAGS